MKFLLAFIVFIVVNLHLGTHLFRQFREFKYKIAPFSVVPLKENIQAAGKVTACNDRGKERTLFRRNIPPAVCEYLFFPHGLPQGDFGEEECISLRVPVNFLFLDGSYREETGAYLFRFLELKGNRLVLQRLSNKKDFEKVLEFETLNISISGRLTAIEFAKPVDLEGDGQEEVIVGVVTYYDRLPRGLVCFDAGTGKLLWEYYCGPRINNWDSMDLDRDGKKEIVIETYALNNGAEINGSSDAYSYVIVLGSNGKELWKKVTQDWYSLSFFDIADMDKDGILDIVAAASCHRARAKERGKLYIFAGSSGEEKASYSIADASFSRPSARVNAKGETRVFVGDSRGRLWLFDRYLRPRQIVKEESQLFVLDNPAAKRRYIFATTQKNFLVYDMDIGAPLFRCSYVTAPGYIVYNYPRLESIDRGGGNYLLTGDRMSYIIKEPRVPFALILKNLITGGLLFTFMLLLLFNSFFFLSLSRLKSGGYFHPRPKGEVDPRFFETIQEKARRLKDPISTVLWTAEKIKRGAGENVKDIDRETYLELACFLEEDVKILKREINNILRLVQSEIPLFVETDLKALLLDLVEQYDEETKGKTGIVLNMTGDITLSLDRELFKTVITNLMENSLTALTEGGRATVFTFIVRPFVKGFVRQAQIEVRPFFTGEDQEAVLFLCRRFAAAHRGKIKIYRHRGSGGKIALIIPLRSRSRAG